MRAALEKAHAARRVLVTVTCSCGWSGEVGVTADCPSCGANEHARINAARAMLLEKLSNPDMIAVAHIEMSRCPLIRNKLVALKLIVGDGKRAEPGGSGGSRPKGATYKLTERGGIALAAYRAMKEAEVQLRRKLAGETARRHAELPTAGYESGIRRTIAAVDAEMPPGGWRDGVVDVLDAGIRKGPL